MLKNRVPEFGLFWDLWTQFATNLLSRDQEKMAFLESFGNFAAGIQLRKELNGWI